MDEKQKREAVIRLKQLNHIYGLNEGVVKDFESNGLIHCVATTTAYDNSMEWIGSQIESLKKDKGILPYYIILDPVFINVLYVGSYEEDWFKERPDYEKNLIFAFVFNMQRPEYSEFGSIAIEGFDEAVLRVG